MSGPTNLSLKAPGFWRRVANAQGVLFKDGGLWFASLPDKASMDVILRDKKEMFHDTVNRVANDYTVIINGIFYDVTYKAQAAAAASKTAAKVSNFLQSWKKQRASAADPSEVTPEGILRQGNNEIGGRSAPDMFYMAYNSKQRPRYKFGKGDPPKNVENGFGFVGAGYRLADTWTPDDEALTAAGWTVPTDEDD